MELTGHLKFAYLLIFCLFILRLQFLPRLNLQNGQLIRVTGILAEEPQTSGNRQSFHLGRIEVWTEKFPEHHYGDKLEVIGKIKVQNYPLGSFINPLISFENYWLSYPKISDVTGTTGITSIGGLAINLRNQLKKVYQQSLPSPLDGILTGIVLGDKNLIPQDLWQKLKQTGTLHIMVASGMNIAFFSGPVLSLLALFFKRRIAIILLFTVIWFYSLVTGLQPPIVRAAIMASLVYFSHLVGREAEGGWVLFLTAVLMLFLNPLLFFDIGFRLSFLATAGLIYLSPKLKATHFFLFRQETFTSSVAAQLATLPILVASFGQLNLISPLINLTILWCVPLILQLGIIVGLIGLFWQNLGQVSSYFLLPFLIFIKQIVDWSAKMALFQVLLPEVKWFWWLGYYCLLGWWIKRHQFEICGKY